MMVGSRRVWTAAALVVLLGSVPLTARPALGVDSAVVTVDAAAALGALNNPAWSMNQTRSLRPGERARQRELGPSRTVRVWAKPHQYYDHLTGAYDFTRAYGYLDDAAAGSEQILANVDQCDQPLMDLAAPDTCRAVLKATIRHLKQRYPGLRYIELFNEPDKGWTPAPDEMPAIPVDQYYQWFRLAYAVVDEVNAELAPALPLALGGPVTYHFNGGYLRGFLDRFAADPDPAKRLDFISYHEYGRRANPADVRTAKSTIRSWLTTRGIHPDTPVFVTEYGVFPGPPDAPAGHGPDYADDLLTQAAAMAALGINYVRGGTDMPMHWVYNHPTNERKSMFVDEADGAVHPYFNVVRMQRMLKATRVDSRSTALSGDGIGVDALATRDSTGVAVLATNYQWTTGTAEYQVRVDVTGLPAEFTGMQVLVERYLVDATTSNYAHDPAAADLRRVERYVLPAGASASAAFPLRRNAVSLLVLTPVVHAEAETLPATASAGDLVQGIADPAATGGRLSKLTAGAVGDFVRYRLTVPRPGGYRVTARLKRAPDRCVVRLDVDGTPLGEPFDGHRPGYDFVEVDFGRHTFATAGGRDVTFTAVGSSGGGYTVGVDSITLIPSP